MAVSDFRTPSFAHWCVVGIRICIPNYKGTLLAKVSPLFLSGAGLGPYQSMGAFQVCAGAQPWT